MSRYSIGIAVVGTFGVATALVIAALAFHLRSRPAARHPNRENARKTGVGA